MVLGGHGLVSFVESLIKSHVCRFPTTIPSWFCYRLQPRLAFMSRLVEASNLKAANVPPAPKVRRIVDGVFCESRAGMCAAAVSRFGSGAGI